MPLVAVTPVPQDLPGPAEQPGDGGRGRSSPAASVEEVFSTEGAGEEVLHSLDTVVANTLPTPDGPRDNGRAVSVKNGNLERPSEPYKTLPAIVLVRLQHVIRPIGISPEFGVLLRG